MNGHFTPIYLDPHIFSCCFKDHLIFFFLFFSKWDEKKTNNKKTTIRAVAGQHSSPGSRLANKIKMHLTKKTEDHWSCITHLSAEDYVELEQTWKHISIQCCISFHPCRSIRKQICPYHKNCQGQPRVIIWKHMYSSTRCCIPSFKVIVLLVLKKKIF